MRKVLPSMLQNSKSFFKNINIFNHIKIKHFCITKCTIKTMENAPHVTTDNPIIAVKGNRFYFQEDEVDIFFPVLLAKHNENPWQKHQCARQSPNKSLLCVGEERKGAAWQGRKDVFRPWANPQPHPALRRLLPNNTMAQSKISVDGLEENGKEREPTNWKLEQ